MITVFFFFYEMAILWLWEVVSHPQSQIWYLIIRTRASVGDSIIELYNLFIPSDFIFSPTTSKDPKGMLEVFFSTCFFKIDLLSLSLLILLLLKIFIIVGFIACPNYSFFPLFAWSIFKVMFDSWVKKWECEEHFFHFHIWLSLLNGSTYFLSNVNCIIWWNCHSFEWRNVLIIKLSLIFFILKLIFHLKNKKYFY